VTGNSQFLSTDANNFRLKKTPPKYDKYFGGVFMGTKKSFEEVRDFFNKAGCQLLEGEYHGCYHKMNYRCSCGNDSITTWNNFLQGKRCGLCVRHSPKKKRSLGEVQKIFRDRGCEFLDDHFKGVNYNHKYRCKCGKESEISLAGFHFQNQNCKECGLDKCRGENHHSWHQDREQYKKDRRFANRCRLILKRSLRAVGLPKSDRTGKMLGYTPQQLLEHLSKHPDWESLQEIEWHVDHIFPITAFMERGIKDIKLINSLQNLQPMAGLDNVAKGNKYDKPEFEDWLKQMGHLD
jgi:hypothetical protein